MQSTKLHLRIKGTENKITGNFTYLASYMMGICLLNDSTGEANAVVVLHAKKTPEIIRHLQECNLHFSNHLQKSEGDKGRKQSQKISKMLCAKQHLGNVLLGPFCQSSPKAGAWWTMHVPACGWSNGPMVRVWQQMNEPLWKHSRLSGFARQFPGPGRSKSKKCSIGTGLLAFLNFVLGTFDALLRDFGKGWPFP